MNFSKFSLKRGRKDSSEEESFKKGIAGSDYLSFDLFYQLAYMSSIAAAGIPRSQIFEFASQLPCTSAHYFEDIHTLAKQMRYDYAVASRLVGESADNDVVKSLLLRLASSLGSGEAEADFLAQEAKIQAESFQNEYERDVESLRKWTEGYASLIVSAALIVMVAAVSMLIYPVAKSFTIIIVGVTICVAAMGSWMIFRVAPKEVRVHNPAWYCTSYERTRRLARILLPAAAIGFIVVLVAGMGIGWALIISSALMFPVGVAGMLFDKTVKKKDADISIFLRSLGNVASAIGLTVSTALSRLDLRSTANLAADVTRLSARLDSRLQPDICWQRFSLETGSETVYRSVKMFNDANRLGGDPEEVGFRSSIVATMLDFLRAKRSQVSASFGYLAIAMHIAIVGLLSFVVQVLLMFGEVLENVYTESVVEAQEMASNMFTFSFEGIEFLQAVVLPCIIVLSLTTAFAAAAADGGNKYKFFSFLALTLGSSGAVMVLVPVAADSIFGSMSAM